MEEVLIVISHISHGHLMPRRPMLEGMGARPDDISLFEIKAP